jgi:hypothetical protein
MARFLTGGPVAVLVAAGLVAAMVGVERVHVGATGRSRTVWALTVFGATTIVVGVAVARFVTLP